MPQLNTVSRGPKDTEEAHKDRTGGKILDEITSLSTLHNLELGIDPYSAAKSQPDVTPDTSNDEITTKLNRMKRRVRTSSVRGTTNN